jgi:hypothetical protein
MATDKISGHQRAQKGAGIVGRYGNLRGAACGRSNGLILHGLQSSKDRIEKRAASN